MEQPKARLTLQQHQQAINEAIWIDASPHEWPTVDKMWLLCSALIDSVQMVDYLRSRLAAVEAERDAARAERDAARAKAESTWLCFHCGFCTTDRTKALAHFGDQDEEMALCRWWNDSTDAERVQAIQDALQEQIEARAGEARAVEALKRIAAQPGCGCKPICQCRTLESRSIELEAKMDIAAEAVEASKPALDWLAQQRREAAAEALKKLATDLRQDQWGSVLHDVDSLRSILRTRAAALRAGGGGND